MAGAFFFGVMPNAAAARENILVDVEPGDLLDENIDDPEVNEDLAAERNMDDADDGLLVVVAARSVAAPEPIETDGLVEG